MRRIPIIPTLVVLAAVASMVRLGFWQIDRLHQKEALLARYQAARGLSSQVPWPRTAAEQEAALYRHSALTCDRKLELTSRSGRSDRGEPGWTHVVRCAIAGGGVADIAIGWTRELPVEHSLPPGAHGFRWKQYGEIHGIIGPHGKSGVILVANPPIPGTAANAMPDPNDIPNNHLSYAVQWFLFALTALVIYGLALRKRLKE